MNIEDKSLEEQVEELKNVPGNEKGDFFHTFFVYVSEKEGEEAKQKLLKKTRELNLSFNLEEIRPLDWYPKHMGVILIIVAKDLFNWTMEDIFNLGRYSARDSFVMRMLLRYATSMKRLFERAPKDWKKHYDFGALEAVELNEEEKYAIVRIKGFKFHPVMCKFHAGYFDGIAQLCVKSGKITIEETKCVHKGDPHEEYVLRWE